MPERKEALAVTIASVGTGMAVDSPSRAVAVLLMSALHLEVGSMQQAFDRELLSLEPVEVVS
jgi:hypothetical protein